MTPIITFTEELRHFHLFCGLGGGARGFNRASPRAGNILGKWRCIGGVDNNPKALRNFKRLAGIEGTLLDMFSREQYIKWHEKEPPREWREATPLDILLACGGEIPDAVVTSPPCKGFSGLLSETLSKTLKYQALNELTIRGLWLCLEAFKDKPVPIYILENVPRILTRGKHLLDQIERLFRAYGYVVAWTVHNCGEVGGLGQSRERMLMVARHVGTVPNFLYQPEKKSLKGVGEILGKLPVPGNGAGGPMHRIPSLQWKTWVRLAFVKPGKDWRSLNDLRVVDGKLADYLIIPENRNHGMFGVQKWEEPSGTVTSRAMPNNGNFSVADPRMDRGDKWKGGWAYGVRPWDEPTGAVTGQGGPGQGPYSVADPRMQGLRNGPFGVSEWNKPSTTIAGKNLSTNGTFSVADPRLTTKQKGDNFYGGGEYGVTAWDEHSGAIKGAASHDNGKFSVADPRHHGAPKHNNEFRVVRFDEASGAITSAHGSGQCVADPRDGRNNDSGKYKVTKWEHPSGCVISGDDHGAYAVADPRGGQNNDSGSYKVGTWDEASGAVVGHSKHGAYAVADPRPGLKREKGDHYLTGGHYGVVPWESHSGAISGHASHDNGRNSVADPRMPEATDKCVVYIRSLYGSWNRPFTTLECAALQSLFDPEEHFELEGSSDTEHREQIGNAIPPDAFTEVGRVIGETILGARSGQTFMLSNTPIWVRNVAIALSVHQPVLE